MCVVKNPSRDDVLYQKVTSSLSRTYPETFLLKFCPENRFGWHSGNEKGREKKEGARKGGEGKPGGAGGGGEEGARVAAP